MNLCCVWKATNSKGSKMFVLIGEHRELYASAYEAAIKLGFDFEGAKSVSELISAQRLVCLAECEVIESDI